MLVAGGRKVLNAATLGRYNERLSAMAENAAQILSSTGMQRDQYFSGLIRHLQSQGVTAGQAKAVAVAVEQTLMGSIASGTDLVVTGGP